MRGPLTRSLWLASAALLSLAAPARAEEPLTAEAALTALVEATPGARRPIAKALAARTDVTLEGWLRTMRGFGTHQAAVPGVRDHEVVLDVLRRGEPTLITVFVPSGYDPGTPAPLMMSLHGSGGDGRYHYRQWQSLAEALGMIVVCPTDQRGIGGFTGSTAEHAAAWAALRWARLHFNIDESRIHASGVSRGGHLLWDLALRQPDRFASIAPMIGGPLMNIAGGRNNVRYAENLVNVTIRDLQGAKDDRLLVDNLRRIFARLKAFGARDAKLVEFPHLGHSYVHGTVDWKKLLTSARRAAVPKHVVRRSARPNERRSHWVEILHTRPPVKEVFTFQVAPRTWNALGPDGQRAHVVREAEKRTARVEARFLGKGRFEVRTTGVKRMRLLLDDSMFDPAAPVEVVLNGRTKKLRARHDKRLLLEDFAERFDRTFLPVAAITLRP